MAPRLLGSSHLFLAFSLHLLELGGLTDFVSADCLANVLNFNAFVEEEFIHCACSVDLQDNGHHLLRHLSRPYTLLDQVNRSNFRFLNSSDCSNALVIFNDLSGLVFVLDRDLKHQLLHSLGELLLLHVELAGPINQVRFDTRLADEHVHQLLIHVLLGG